MRSGSVGSTALQRQAAGQSLPAALQKRLQYPMPPVSGVRQVWLKQSFCVRQLLPTGAQV